LHCFNKEIFALVRNIQVKSELLQKRRRIRQSFSELRQERELSRRPESSRGRALRSATRVLMRSTSENRRRVF